MMLQINGRDETDPKSKASLPSSKAFLFRSSRSPHNMKSFSLKSCNVWDFSRRLEVMVMSGDCSNDTGVSYLSAAMLRRCSASLCVTKSLIRSFGWPAVAGAVLSTSRQKRHSQLKYVPEAAGSRLLLKATEARSWRTAKSSNSGGKKSTTRTVLW